MRADKTLALIDETLRKDQGAKYRGLLAKYMPLSPDAYSEDQFPFRSHLGASLIGRTCDRQLWYTFRWATIPKFDGRMLRLFNRGHLEEPRLIALMETIGCEVWQTTADGKQFRISAVQGHYGGALDAVVRGIPEMPSIPVLGEFKTHNDKSFKKLQSDGLVGSKFEHYVQSQNYMAYNGLSAGLYTAVNKNDDEIHAEIIHCDPNVADRYTKRAHTIIFAATPPPRLKNATPGWHECKFCDHKQVCFGLRDIERTCRSCIHSRPVENGEWACLNPEVVEDEHAQANGITDEANYVILLKKEGQVRQNCPGYHRVSN